MNNKFINSQSAFGELWNEAMSASGAKVVNIDVFVSCYTNVADMNKTVFVSGFERGR